MSRYWDRLLRFGHETHDAQYKLIQWRQEPTEDNPATLISPMKGCVTLQYLSILILSQVNIKYFN